MEYRWRLVYPTGKALDQPEGLGSIRYAPPGAVELIVLIEEARRETRVAGQAVVTTEWAPVCAVRLKGKPLFYQDRAIDVSVGGGLSDGGATSLFAAFGWWDEDRQEANLYTYDVRGYRPLPPERYRESMIALQAGDA